MNDETPSRNSPPHQADIDLAVAFFGSMVVGVLSASLGFTLRHVPGYLWGGRSLFVEWGAGIAVGLLAGFPWGLLCVLTSAGVRSEIRKYATGVMLAILGVLLISWCVATSQ